MYADDLKIFIEISNIEDCLRLQEDVNSVIQWCDINSLCLNKDKCLAVTYAHTAGL